MLIAYIDVVYFMGLYIYLQRPTLCLTRLKALPWYSVFYCHCELCFKLKNSPCKHRGTDVQ